MNNTMINLRVASRKELQDEVARLWFNLEESGWLLFLEHVAEWPMIKPGTASREELLTEIERLREALKDERVTV